MDKPFGAVAIWGCSHLGLWPFGAVAIWGCGRLGLWPFGDTYSVQCTTCTETLTSSTPNFAE